MQMRMRGEFQGNPEAVAKLARTEGSREFSAAYDLIRPRRRFPVKSPRIIKPMNDTINHDQSLATLTFDLSREPIPSDPGANPFRLVVDPVMRIRLRRALFDLIESHDQELARYVGDGTLALDSYKEYVELFARSLRETMNSREGIAYLLESCGFQIEKQEINLQPETRWRVRRDE
jgi:hypothetical protein